MRVAITLLTTLFLTLQAAEPTAAQEVSPELQKQYDEFEKLLTGAKLDGQFTIVGRKQDGPLPKEYYGIESVRKLPEGDKWLIKAQIKYGSTDVVVPLPLDVRFVDNTPMITLTNAKIPLMGEFSARVVFYNGKYAGTWTHHGKGGGHLFGTIERMDEKPAADDKPKN
jgi:hypothetical protein